MNAPPEKGGIWAGLAVVLLSGDHGEVLPLELHTGDDRQVMC